jgi:geranylgeranyl pyrophosphate synthase
MSQLSWQSSPALIEAALEALLPVPAPTEERGFALLQEAMRYAVLGEGKRTRPLLLLEAAHVVCPSGECPSAMPAACAVELIHAYSLVHDDLPAMDDSDTRRGKPSCHKAFGDAIAVLAGDALQTLAFESAAQTGNARVVALLAGAAGLNGMAGGQAIDIEWTNEHDGLSISGEQLLRLHALKTGAMLRVSAEIGAVLGGGSEAQVAALRSYGTHLGRAFQIWDDVLDVIGDPSITGKGSTDADNDKITAVAIWGIAGAQECALEAADAALAALQDFGEEADTLRALARFVVSRNK